MKKRIFTLHIHESVKLKIICNMYKYQVKLRDFPVDPTIFAKVLDFCYENRSDPDLIDKLKNGRLKDQGSLYHFNGMFQKLIRN